MDSSKTEPEKSDSKLKINASAIPKKPMRNSATMESALSKIPKRGVCLAKENSTSKSGMKTSGICKQVGVNKPSTSLMTLTLPKTNSLASSRSCFNSHRSVTSKDQTPRLESTDKISEIKKKAERAASKRNLLSFEAAKEKLQNCQEQFMNKYNMVKDELPKEEKEMKLVCLFKNNEGQLVTKNQATRIVTMCDKKTLEELKTTLKNFAQKKLEAIDSLNQLTKSPREIGDTISKDHEHYKQIEEAARKLQIETKTFLDDFLKEIESLQPNDKLKESVPNKDHESHVKSLLNEVNELRKSLEASQSEYTKTKNICEQKSSTFKKELEERNKIQSKKQMEFDELKKKYDCLEKENVKVKAVSKETGEKLIKKTHDLEDLNQKLKNCAHNNVKLESKNKELELSIDKLNMELKSAVNCDKDLIKDQASRHTAEMNALKNEIINTNKEKDSFEKEVQSLKNETVHLRKIESKFLALQDEVNEANKEKLILNETIKDLAEKLASSQNNASVSRDVQEELTRLQRTDNLNNEKIKKLENDLTKAQFTIKTLEEKIFLDGKLLRVRADLIDSLQTKEKSQKIRLTDLFAEVGEKNTDLQMIKTEILTKTEEFKNLFSTLSTKQMEITRQEHVIKLLQENNERAQNLRVRQEAKIARLEEEVLELKQAISIYQDVVLPNNTLRRNLAIAEACQGDCTDSLGFYVEERRKKRHIDISVKKYEK